MTPNLIGFAVCIHRIGFIHNFCAIADLIGPQSAAWAVSTRTGHNVPGRSADTAAIPLSSPLSTLIAFPCCWAKSKKRTEPVCFAPPMLAGRIVSEIAAYSPFTRKHGTRKAFGSKTARCYCSDQSSHRPWYFPAHPDFRKRPDSFRCHYIRLLQNRQFHSLPE